MPAPDPERRIGPYRLTASLGAGGMGEVHRAEHVDSGAVHALKLLPPLAGAEELRRFQREAEAMARVEGHPNLVRVHASGQEQGRPWIAMELADGGTLGQRLARGPLLPREAADLVRALATGLAHVHARGVLHRDLKPGNVLFDRAGTPKLADWGLARVQGAEPLTATGELLGTPAYMAPEQARGERALDPRTDVYGMGALLFHALTGRAPFVGPTTVAVLTQVLAGAAPDPRSLRPEVPAWLAGVCVRAMAPRPEARFASADDLAQALAGPPGSRFRRVVPGAAAAVAVLLAALGWARSGKSGVASGARQAEATAQVDSGDQLAGALERGEWAAAGALVHRRLDGSDAAWAEVTSLLSVSPAGLAPVASAALAQGASPDVVLLAAESALEGAGSAAAVLELAERAFPLRESARARWALARALVLNDQTAEASQLLLQVRPRASKPPWA